MNAIVLNVCATFILIIGIAANDQSMVAGSEVLYALSLSVIMK